MARLTITLSDERHRALREAAVQRGKTIGQLIEESLDHYGIKKVRRMTRTQGNTHPQAGRQDSPASCGPPAIPRT